MENPSADIPLERLQATPITEVAALLFVEAFHPGKRSPLSFRKIHKHLARMGGLGKRGIRGGRQKADYLIGLECTILWERALLATGMWVGDSASLHVHLLRRGEAVRDGADPLDQARAALKDVLGPMNA